MIDTSVYFEIYSRMTKNQLFRNKNIIFVDLKKLKFLQKIVNTIVIKSTSFFFLAISTNSYLHRNIYKLFRSRNFISRLKNIAHHKLHQLLFLPREDKLSFCIFTSDVLSKISLNIYLKHGNTNS